jgi:hypothetical protein
VGIKKADVTDQHSRACPCTCHLDSHISITLLLIQPVTSYPGRAFIERHVFQHSIFSCQFSVIGFIHVRGFLETWFFSSHYCIHTKLLKITNSRLSSQMHTHHARYKNVCNSAHIVFIMQTKKKKSKSR